MYRYMAEDRAGKYFIAHEEGSPTSGMAVGAGQTGLMSPTLPATLAQMGLFI